jgi:hypothetical protein
MSIASVERNRGSCFEAAGYAKDARQERNRGRRVAQGARAFASRCFPKTIEIPARFQHQSLESLSASGRISTRLSHVLHRSQACVLGDLHGRRVGDFAWQRYCGFKTLQELDSLASAFANKPLWRNRRTIANGQALASPATFVVPKSVCHLRFDELPISKRLANVLCSTGLRTLGRLQGRTTSELLRYEGCGWRTLIEIQQLLERAISGEFDLARVKQSRAVADLLTLLEQGIAKLAPRNREFVLARIDGMTFAEIGWRHGFTRAGAHLIIKGAVNTLRKVWGPRIPRLLEIVKRRCLSIANGSELTPALLERWLCDSSKSFRLPREAQVRLIALLDKDIPCRPDSWNQAKRL